jgi:hypothetical protein
VKAWPVKAFSNSGPPAPWTYSSRLPLALSRIAEGLAVMLPPRPIQPDHRLPSKAISASAPAAVSTYTSRWLSSGS